jgi:formylglycine-generating enzyme required for sulfatase activity
MTKYPLWLVLITVFGLFLSSCNQSTPNPMVSSDSSNSQNPTQNNPIHTITAIQPPPTATPEPTDTPEPVILPTSTASIVPSLVPTELITGSTRISEIDQMEQVYVPAGDFIMGSDDPDAKRTIEGGRAYPEIHAHTVYLDGYWIDKYEVTNGQYALCVEAGVCKPPFNPTSENYPKYWDNPDYANYPVIWINWYMAKGYCEWAGRRQPTEAEWEKAARGTDGRKYPWGNDPISGERANFCDITCTRNIANGKYNDGYAGPAPVGSYPAGASPYGAMDMSGNVWEWNGTLIMPYPYDPNDGREDPDVLGERSWRGGPYSNGIWWMRSSVRYRSVQSYWWMNLGFRCASTK